MKKIRVTFLFAICLPLILLNIHVFSQNQIKFSAISNGEEKRANSAFVTLVNAHLPAGEFKVAFSAKGGSASGGNTYSLSSGVYFYQLEIRDPETCSINEQGSSQVASSGQAITRTKKRFLLNNIFSIFS